MFVKCCEDVEHFKNAACSEWRSEQVGMHIQHACTAWGGGKVYLGYIWDSKQCWGYGGLKSSRAAWLDIWESRIAVSPYARFECIYYSYEANTFSVVLTLVHCSAHPLPFLPERLLRSHLLCSPGLRVLGMNTRCYLPVQRPARTEPFLQDWVTQHCCNGVWLTSGTMTLPILA